MWPTTSPFQTPLLPSGFSARAHQCNNQLRRELCIQLNTCSPWFQLFHAPFAALPMLTASGQTATGVTEE